jgi:predicted glycogen debranching enzyme
MAYRGAATVVRFTREGDGEATLRVRPFLMGRDMHHMTHANDAVAFEPTIDDGRYRWQLYGDAAPVTILCDGTYRHEPYWFRDFQLDEERARGFDHSEDAASPGELHLSLDEPACLVLACESAPGAAGLGPGTAREVGEAILERERRRRGAFPTPLHRSADAFLVARGDGATIVAGYPWFTDWGRDTFIAMRGICLAGGRLAAACAILTAWARCVDQGMLPNRFVEGEAPEFNAVDASLWFCVVVGEYLEACRRAGRATPERDLLLGAVEAIIDGYLAGTRYGIGVDDDALVRAGAEGQQLTWMDARTNGHVVTPRAGKPVEIQALWVNALRVAGRDELADRACASFAARFWNPERGCLYDVVDVDGVAGAVDDAVRPNQLLAVGGLPHALVDGLRARSIVDVAEAQLWTPLGLRTLSPRDEGYCGRYAGGPIERDNAYHQGTAWAWLLGPYVQAWVAVRGGDPETVATARELYLKPLYESLERAGVGHVSEIADGDLPQRENGCPFQAWSVGELLRLEARW